ncbi:MAG: hypothetical protein ACOWWM_17220 [Desulfobacterales bacterium]
MELLDVIVELKDLRIHSRTYHVDDQGEYGEIVFYSEDMSQWDNVLQRHFGAPLKSTHTPVTEELMLMTEPFGEIFDHQALFFRQEENVRIMAMLWPWRDSIHTTLKLIFLRDAKQR